MLSVKRVVPSAGAYHEDGAAPKVEVAQTPDRRCMTAGFNESGLSLKNHREAESTRRR